MCIHSFATPICRLCNQIRLKCRLEIILPKAELALPAFVVAIIVNQRPNKQAGCRNRALNRLVDGLSR